LWIIFIVWAASNFLLLALQALSLGVGFRVHPLGEYREFTRLMANYPGLELHHQFWETLETRNPLAPWWYQAPSKGAPVRLIEVARSIREAVQAAHAL
jgi:hypothetical protein